jgi:hypothetical protein
MLFGNIAVKLLAPQIPHVQHLRRLLREGRTIILDGSDPGTGKTYSGCAIFAADGLRPLLICPKQTVPNWYKICELFGVIPLGVVNYDTLKNGKYYESLNDFYAEIRVECPYIKIIREPRKSRTGELLTTPNGQSKMKVSRIEWTLPPNSICVFDEAHKGKNGLHSGNTLNSQLMVSIRPYLSAASTRYGMIVSATLTDKQENFDVAGYMLDLYKPHTKQTYTQFITRVSGLCAGNIVLGLHKLLYPKCGSRMTIIDIKKQTGDSIFKKNDIKAKAYTADTKTVMQIEYLHKEIQQEMAKIRSKGVTRGFGYIIRCWQKIEILKAPGAAEKILAKYNKNMSVVVFVCFKATKRLLLQRISDENKIPIDKIGFIDGDQTAHEREDVVESFKADRLRVLICQIVAGGESLSLHDIGGLHQRFVLCFPTWSAINLVQALGRIYRAGAKSDAVQRIYYIKPGESGFGTTETSGLETLTDSLHDEEDIPDFDVLISGAGGIDIVIDPELKKLLDQTIAEKAHLTIEEKICICVNAKHNNIDLLNDGVLSGVSLF